MIYIGESLLRDIRLKKGISQEKMARHLGYTLRRYHMFEKYPETIPADKLDYIVKMARKYKGIK